LALPRLRQDQKGNKKKEGFTKKTEGLQVKPVKEENEGAWVKEGKKTKSPRGGGRKTSIERKATVGYFQKVQNVLERHALSIFIIEPKWKDPMGFAKSVLGMYQRPVGKKRTQ